MTPRLMLYGQLRPRLRLSLLLEACPQFSGLAIFTARDAAYFREELIELDLGKMTSDLCEVGCGVRRHRVS